MTTRSVFRWPRLEVGWTDYDGLHPDGRSDGAVSVEIQAGISETVRVVPPAGEEHAYDRVDWPHRVTVYVSPTGRSVRIWIDGDEIEVPKRRRRRRV